MSACIGDCIVNKVAREIWIVCVTIERKLQDAHPRQLKLVTQGLHVGSIIEVVFTLTSNSLLTTPFVTDVTITPWLAWSPRRP